MANAFTTLSIMNHDYKVFEAIRDKWVKEHKAKISMPQMIKIAMEEYSETHN